MIRAVEVCLLAKSAFGSQHRAEESLRGWRAIKIGRRGARRTLSTNFTRGREMRFARLRMDGRCGHGSAPSAAGRRHSRSISRLQRTAARDSRRMKLEEAQAAISKRRAATPTATTWFAATRRFIGIAGCGKTAHQQASLAGVRAKAQCRSPPISATTIYIKSVG